jgi:hypothetical protein
MYGSSIRNGDTSMPMIDQPAPQFTAQAVIDGGEFKEIKLSDYKGKVVLVGIRPLALALFERAGNYLWHDRTRPAGTTKPSFSSAR